MPGSGFKFSAMLKILKSFEKEHDENFKVVFDFQKVPCKEKKNTEVMFGSRKVLRKEKKYEGK